MVTQSAYVCQIFPDFATGVSGGLSRTQRTGRYWGVSLTLSGFAHLGLIRRTGCSAQTCTGVFGLWGRRGASPLRCVKNKFRSRHSTMSSAAYRVRSTSRTATWLPVRRPGSSKAQRFSEQPYQHHDESDSHSTSNFFWGRFVIHFISSRLNSQRLESFRDAVN